MVFSASNPLKGADYFALLFDRTPTYTELRSGTPKLAPYIKLIELLSGPKSSFVPSEGFRWNPIFDSLIHTYNELLKLGFSYYNGKVVVIQDDMEAEHA